MAHLHNHLIRIGILLLLTLAIVREVGVNLLVIEIDAVQVRLNPRAQRAEGVDALRTCPLAILELQVTRRNIVTDRVANDVIAPLLWINIL